MSCPGKGDIIPIFNIPDFKINVSSGSGPLHSGPITSGPIAVLDGGTIHFWSAGSIGFDVIPGSVSVELYMNNIDSGAGEPIDLPPDPSIEALWADTDTGALYYWDVEDQEWKVTAGGVVTAEVEAQVVCDILSAAPPLEYWFGADALLMGPRDGFLINQYEVDLNLVPRGVYALDGRDGDDAEWASRLKLYDPGVNYGFFNNKQMLTFATNAQAANGIFSFTSGRYLVWWDLGTGEPLGFANIGFSAGGAKNFTAVVYDDVQEVLWVWLGGEGGELLAVSVAEREQWGTDPFNPYVISTDGAMPSNYTCSFNGRVCNHGIIFWDTAFRGGRIRYGDPLVGVDTAPPGNIFRPLSSSMGIVRDHDNDEMFLYSISPNYYGTYEFYPLSTNPWNDPIVSPRARIYYFDGPTSVTSPGPAWNQTLTPEYWAPIVIGSNSEFIDDFVGSRCPAEIFQCSDRGATCLYKYNQHRRDQHSVGITNGNVWITWTKRNPSTYDVDCGRSRNFNVTGRDDCANNTCVPTIDYPLIVAEWKKESRPEQRSHWVDLSTASDPALRFPNKLPNAIDPRVNARRGAFWMDLYRPGQVVTGSGTTCDITANLDFTQMSLGQIQDLKNTLNL